MGGVVLATPDVIRVLEVDPDLGEDLEPSDLAVARPRVPPRLARRVANDMF